MNRELEIARKAAQAGAETIRSFQKNRSQMGIRSKGYRDLVTDADVAAEKVIVSVIKEAFPEDHILAEESKVEVEFTSGRWWIIDPIDGTTNFAHDFPIFCVSIGFWEAGKAQAGVVLEVNRKEEFYAVKGSGAFCNGERIHVSDRNEMSECIIAAGMPYHTFDEEESYLKLFRTLLHNCLAIRRPGTGAYDLCSVAAGRFDGFYEYGLQPWDVGAAALIVEEAGGVVTNWYGTKEWLFANRMIAGNPAIHPELLSLITEYVPEEVRDGSVKAGQGFA